MNFDEKVVDRIKKLEREVERLRVKESPDMSSFVLTSQFAYASYSPTAASSGGTITTKTETGSYFQVGKLVFVKLIISITTNGTGSGSIIVTLPVNQAATFKDTFSGYVFVAASGVQKGQLQVQSYPLGSVRIYKYDGTYPGEDGVRLIVTGYYEVA